MLQSFTAGLRESLQCSLLLALLMGVPTIRARAVWAVAGLSLAFLSGFFLNLVPGLADLLPSNEWWAMLRHGMELGLFYLGFAFLAMGKDGFKTPAGPFLLGVAFYFFEARALGFLALDAGTLAEAVIPALGAALLGSALGFVPLALFRDRLGLLKLDRLFTLPSLLVALGALKFAMGGVGELGNANILISLQRGMQEFLESAVARTQEVLMIGSHGFIQSPLAGVASFLSSDRAAVSLMVLLVMAPPVAVLARTFSRPDPVVEDLENAAERRLAVSFFRTDLLLRSVPAVAAFVLLFVSLHAVNVSLNPMFEPAPVTVREAEGREGVLEIPLSDRTGEFTDGKLRKYVYYYGNRRILFLAVLKPDGTVGVGLDECEICKPPEWNKAAQGYAQRGENLVCKYCMTPILIPSVNSPGGCNPIPVPFSMEEKNIVITLDDLIRVFREASALEKKGSHL